MLDSSTGANRRCPLCGWIVEFQDSVGQPIQAEDGTWQYPHRGCVRVLYEREHGEVPEWHY